MEGRNRKEEAYNAGSKGENVSLKTQRRPLSLKGRKDTLSQPMHNVFSREEQTIIFE